MFYILTQKQPEGNWLLKTVRDSSVKPTPQCFPVVRGFQHRVKLVQTTTWVLNSGPQACIESMVPAEPLHGSA